MGRGRQNHQQFLGRSSRELWMGKGRQGTRAEQGGHPQAVGGPYRKARGLSRLAGRTTGGLRHTRSFNHQCAFTERPMYAKHGQASKRRAVSSSSPGEREGGDRG